MSLCRPFITPESTSPCALVTHVNYDRSFPVSFPLSILIAPFSSESALLFYEPCVFEAYTSLSRVGQTAATPLSAAAKERGFGNTLGRDQELCKLRSQHKAMDVAIRFTSKLSQYPLSPRR
jgi:hypothetical protein